MCRFINRSTWHLPAQKWQDSVEVESSVIKLFSSLWSTKTTSTAKITSERRTRNQFTEEKLYLLIEAYPIRHFFFFCLFQPYSKCSSSRQDTLSFSPFMVFEAVLKRNNLKKSSVIVVPFSELRRRWGGGIKCCIYYSFKIFPQFWMAKSTSIIHHNQLLMTKFGRLLCLTRKWGQKCSPL